jgi:hypothetical protein
MLCSSPAGVVSQPDMTNDSDMDDRVADCLLREHGTRKSRELAGWKACATPEGVVGPPVQCGEIKVDQAKSR